MQKHVILFLAANPRGTGRLALDDEARAINLELERSSFRDRFELVTRWAVRPDDLLRELRKLKPTVVHFSGHGGRRTGLEPPVQPACRDFEGGTGEQDGLFLQGADGTARFIAPSAIAETFDAIGSPVKLVVLNACYSAVQAEALLAQVDCVVGMSGAITDEAARNFAIGFYGGIGASESVAAAYKQGRAAIALEGLRDANLPKLVVRAGVDASQLVFAAPTSSSPAPSDVTAATQTRSNVRRPPERREIFVGRDAELARIGAAIAVDASHATIVAIQGMAGVGKTYLAQQLYAYHRERFSSYHHLVLDPNHPGTLATWMVVLGNQAGIDLPQADELSIAEALRARRALVHVDNVDSVEAAELAAALTRALGGVAMVITGRYTELGIAAGTGWLRLVLSPLAPELALRLLHAELDATGLAPPDADLQRLASEVAGLPLALHLAAGYLRRGLTVERFLARLRERDLALKPSDPADHVLDDRARGVLSTSFAISRELLLAQAGTAAVVWEAALAAIGWAPAAGFGPSLGAWITGLTTTNGAFDDFIEAATSLSLVHRLRPEERPTTGWAVNSLLGEFLRGETERALIDRRIGLWIMRRAAVTRTAGANQDRATRWDALSLEMAAVVEWLAVATDDVVRKVVPTAWPFATSRGPVGAWLAAARRVRDAGDRSVLWALCQLALQNGDYDTVLEAAGEMASLAAADDDDRDRALALGKISDVHFARGELDEVLRIRRGEMLPVYERLGDQRERARTWFEIARALLGREERDEALRIFQDEALPVFRRLGDVEQTAHTLAMIGVVKARHGDEAEALRIWREDVIPMFVSRGDHSGHAQTLTRIVDVLAARGDVDEALRLARDEILPIADRLGTAPRASTLKRIAKLEASAHSNR